VIARGAAVWTLVVLTFLNFVNYVDRYVLAAVLESMKLDPVFAGYSDAELGLFATAFMITYMIAAPPAGVLGRKVRRKYLVAVGVLIWSAATIGSGLAHSYNQMLTARAFIGFGEAGYATVAPAILSDLFDKRARGRILSVFYLATPVGSALGFILGGVVASKWGWRPAFFVAGVPGIVFAILALFTVDPPRGAHDEDRPERPPFWTAIRDLMRGEYISITVGGALMTFSVGGLGFWVPTWLQEARGMSKAAAPFAFGVVAVVAGTIGTFTGGFLGDAWQRRNKGGYLLLSGLGLLVAAPFALFSPFLASLPLAFGMLFLAELFVFLNTGPLNTALVNSVNPEVRELGVGLNILCIHLFGDAFSPPILGAISDRLKAGGMPADRAGAWAIAATAVPLFFGGLVLLRQARRR
jgi:MFS family permease